MIIKSLDLSYRSIALVNKKTHFDQHIYRDLFENLVSYSGCTDEISTFPLPY